MERHPIKILYVAGFGRNGGTLLDRVLGEVHGFFSLGEFKFVWKKGILENELCTCGVPFRECAFWSEVFHQAFGGLDGIDAKRIMKLYSGLERTRHLPMLVSPVKSRAFRERLEDYTSVLEKLYRTISKLSGSAVLVNSSKFAGHALLLNRLEKIDLHVLHLVRDSRGAAYSWKKKKRRIERLDRIAYLRQRPAIATALIWNYRNLSSEILRFYAKTYHLLRYEDFVSSPRSHVERIVERVGGNALRLPFLNEYTVYLSKSHTQSGNPVRFVSGNLEIRLDDEWTREMSALERRVVEGVTWPLLIKYGYRKRY
jgi:hypothetical protein